MKSFILTWLVAIGLLLPASGRAEIIDVLIKGMDDGVVTSRDRDYKEAVMNAMLNAIERAGVEITSITKVENFALKYDLTVSRAKAVLLPGYQIIDIGYQQDKTYQVVLSGKVQVGEGKDAKGKNWGKIRSVPRTFQNFQAAYEQWALALAARVENRFINNEDGSVADEKTGLMWATFYEMKEDFSKASVSIALLNKKNFAGHSDWRIPTVNELATLLKNKPSAKLDSGRESYLDPLFDVNPYCWYLWSSDDCPEGRLIVYVGEKGGGLALAGDHYQSGGICVACLKAVRSIPPGP